MLLISRLFDSDNADFERRLDRHNRGLDGAKTPVANVQTVGPRRREPVVAESCDFRLLNFEAAIFNKVAKRLAVPRKKMVVGFVALKMSVARFAFVGHEEE